MKPRVLILDDEKQILSAMQRSLTSEFDIFTTRTPEQAIEFLNNNDVDAIISDYALGGDITGADFLERLVVGRPYISRIMLTGFSMSHIAQEAVNKAGVFKFLTKPWDDNELKLVLYAAANRSKVIKNNMRLAKEIKDKNKKIELTAGMIERDLKLREKKINKSKEHLSSYQNQLSSINHLLEKISSGKTIKDIASSILMGISDVVSCDDSCIVEMTEGIKTMNIYSKSSDRVVDTAGLKDVDGVMYAVRDGGYKPLILNSIYATDEIKRTLLGSTDFYSMMIYPIHINIPEQPSRIFMVVLARCNKKVFERDETTSLTSILSSIRMALERLNTTNYLYSVLKQWENTFNSILDPLFIISLEYDVLRINGAMENMLAQSCDSVIGKKCYNTFNANGKVCDGCLINKAITSGHTVSAEDVPCFQKSSILASAHPVFDSDGNMSSVIQYNNDRSAEFKLYKQLVQSEKLAAVGMLASNIAHEINNPLGGVLAYSQILKKEIDGKGKDQFYTDLTEIEDACLRAKSIISNLLDFSRDSSNDGKMQVPLQKVINDTLPLLNICLRGHKLNVILHEAPLMVVGNVGQLQQVVFNLITNAVHASGPSGEIAITLKAEENKAVLLVSDKGCGMPKEVMEKIFEPFFTTKEKGHGTGLGLFVCYGIVTAHDGTINVQSTAGEGTTFRVDLPLWRE